MQTSSISLIAVTSSTPINQTALKDLASTHHHWHFSGYHGKHLAHYDKRDFKSPLSSAKTWLAVGYPPSKYPLIEADRGLFSRELWGRHWLLAAEGTIPAFLPVVGNYEAIGESFCERLLCDCLNKVRQSIPRDIMPQQLAHFLAELTLEYHNNGVQQFLLTNGEWLFVSSKTDLQLDGFIINNDVNNRSLHITNSSHFNINTITHKDDPRLKGNEWALFNTGELITTGCHPS